MSENKLIKKEGCDGDTRYCFKLYGKKYIFIDIGSGSTCRGEIIEVENDKNLDMLLKDWDVDKIDTPEDLPKEDAI